MDTKIDRLNDIKIENFIWIIYIGIIFLSWYANSREKDYILTNNDDSRKEYQNIMIFIFTILIFVYYYFAKDSYDELKKIKPNESEKTKYLSYLSFIGSALILISGILFLIIAVEDDNIDVEIAFN
mgnify:CR=1 FL=1